PRVRSSDWYRRFSRADYLGPGDDSRLVVHHETEVTVRADQGIEDVIGSRIGDAKAFQGDVGRQGTTISPIQNFPDANRAHGTEEGLTLRGPRERDHPDIGQVGPDFLAVGYVRLLHPLAEAKGPRLQCDAVFHTSLLLGPSSPVNDDGRSVRGRGCRRARRPRAVASCEG